MTPVGRSEQIQAMLDSRTTAVLGADINRLLRQLQKAPKVTIGTRIVGTLPMRMDVFEAHAALRCPGTTVDRDGNHATVDQLISRTKNDFERFREQKKKKTGAPVPPLVPSAKKVRFRILLYTGPYYKAFCVPLTSIGRSTRLFLVIQKET